jgi:hypothetical protein
VGGTDVLGHVRALVSDAEQVEDALEKWLIRAHDDRKTGGLGLADAVSEYWTASENPFWTWLGIVMDADLTTDVGWQRIEAERGAMVDALRRTALAIFNAHVELSEFDPRKQKRVAEARRGLRKSLWPAPAGAAAKRPIQEVTS